MRGTANQPSTTTALTASTARSTDGAKASAMEARRGETPPGGSMRSTTARPGIAGRRTKPHNLETASAENLTAANPDPRFFAHVQVHGSTKSALRRSAEADPRFDSDPYFHKGASVRNTRARTQQVAVNQRDPFREWRISEKRRRPAERGAGATLSRPCCATRSGCARRPRLRPSGHRSSPGTTGHRASPTCRAGPPC